MTKLILTGLIAIVLGLGQIAAAAASPLGQPWTTITQDGH